MVSIAGHPEYVGVIVMHVSTSGHVAQDPEVLDRDHRQLGVEDGCGRSRACGSASRTESVEIVTRSPPGVSGGDATREQAAAVLVYRLATRVRAPHRAQARLGDTR
jgi:hypothetical protein